MPKQSYKELYKLENREENTEKKWEDNITEWTGEVLSDNLRRAVDRQIRHELVVRCSDAPTVVLTIG